MRTAVVTGAARGLGAAIARRLHDDGDRVVLADLDADGAERVAAELGERATALEHDVRDLDSWERLLNAVGDVDVLVNNAARTELRSFWEIDLDEWDDVLATNLRGTYLGCRVRRSRHARPRSRPDRQPHLRRRAGVAGGHRRPLRDLEGRDRGAHPPRRD